MANETGVGEPIAGNRIEKITTADLKPEVPEIGGSVIVLQRNASDRNNRKALEDSPEFGTLDPGEAEKTRLESKAFFEHVFGGLTQEERGTLNVLVVAADTKLNLPDGRKSEHKRAVETADQVVAGLNTMDEFSISKNQLLNKKGKPIELSSGRLKDLKMLEDSPEFVKFLRDKCTADGIFDERKFWVSYESDEYRQERERMNAEGPIDIANRVNGYMRVLANAAKSWHEKHPGRRLVVWAVSHYDSISPFVKKNIVGMDEQTFLDTYLKVDSRAGVVFNLGKDGSATTEIKGQKYNFFLA